jgi:hypothetical protein
MRPSSVNEARQGQSAPNGTSLSHFSYLPPHSRQRFGGADLLRFNHSVKQHFITCALLYNLCPSVRADLGRLGCFPSPSISACCDKRLIGCVESRTLGRARLLTN